MEMVVPCCQQFWALYGNIKKKVSVALLVIASRLWEKDRERESEREGVWGWRDKGLGLLFSTLS